MSNPNGDRIAALARQTGSPQAEVTADIAAQYLNVAAERGEYTAAIVALNFAIQWLEQIAQTDEPTQAAQEQGLVLQNLLAKDADGDYREPITRLLSAVAQGDTVNPNPTPAFGSL